MYETEESIILLLISLGITIAVFLILRSIMLWYWKVNTVVKNQERTNELLEKLFIQMGGEEDEIKTKPIEVIEETIKKSPYSDNLEELMSNVQPTEVILKSKSTGSYEIVSKIQWENDQRDGFDKDFEVAYDPKR